MATKRKPPEQVAASRKKSNENLKKGKATQFKSGDEEAKKAQSKGGKRSQQVQRENRTARQMLEEIMSLNPVLTPQLRAGITNLGGDPDQGRYSAGYLGFVALQQKVLKGDVQATKLWLEITGQDPKVLLEQERLAVEKEALKKGIGGYSALDDAFSTMALGGDDQ